MRVLHVARSAPPVLGGLEASVGGLAAAQHARGLDVVVASIAGGEGVRGGVRYLQLRRVGPRRYPFALGLEPLLRRADVVHVHGIDGLLDQVVGRHAAVGVSTHGGYFHTPRQAALKRLFAQTWTRRSLSRAAAVWFTSETDRRAYGGDGEVIGDGVDPTELRVARCPVPGRWLLPGRVDVHKGVDRLVDRLQELRRPIQLRVVGPEARVGLVAALAARARGLDVVFVGAADRATWLAELAAADRVVLPSRAEGFGIAALEAMTAKVPLIYAAIPAFEELAGAPGVDFDQRGGASLVARDAVAAADVERLAARAAAFAWDRVSARFQAAYERIVR